MSETTTTRPPGYLRDEMPACAAFIASLREVFGADEINLSIRLGMAGTPNKFHAIEGGREIGTPFDGASIHAAVAS